VLGTLQDVLENEGDANGRVLEALDVPRWRAGMHTNALATDLLAWEHTRGKPGSGHMSEFPIGHMRCATVSVEGSMPAMGKIGEGLNVCIDCVVGNKVVFVASDNSDGEFVGIPSNSLEAIVLPPGSRM